MKHSNVTLFLLLLTSYSFSQNILTASDSLAKSFLGDISSKKYFRRVSYFDTLSQSTISELREAINQKTFSKKSKTITLTDEERLKINSELEALDITWLTRNFEKTILVTPEDSTHIPTGISYKFSKPIFLRQNSLCLFYYGVSCPMCGERKFAFYIKQKGKWTEYLTIFLWQS